MKTFPNGIRTLKTWAVYVPERQAILSWHRTKKEAQAVERAKRKGYAVVVQMKGTYAHHR